MRPKSSKCDRDKYTHCLVLNTDSLSIDNWNLPHVPHYRYKDNNVVYYVLCKLENLFNGCSVLCTKTSQSFKNGRSSDTEERKTGQNTQGCTDLSSLSICAPDSVYLALLCICGFFLAAHLFLPCPSTAAVLAAHSQSCTQGNIHSRSALCHTTVSTGPFPLSSTVRPQKCMA